MCEPGKFAQNVDKIVENDSKFAKNAGNFLNKNKNDHVGRR